MISLIDTMQPDFDRATLDYFSDVELGILQAKTDASIAGWKQQVMPLEAHEEMFLAQLESLADDIRNTLNRRYGCTD